MALIEPEIIFLKELGFSSIMIVTFGFIQLLAGSFISTQKYSLICYAIAALTFSFTAISTFTTGHNNIPYLSLIPLTFLLIIFYLNQRSIKSTIDNK